MPPCSSRAAAARPLLAIALACMWTTGGCAEPAARQPPDLVLIVIDTWRWDALGANGSPHPGITPNLDRVARRGVRFERAFVPAPWTAPSMASLFTGHLPGAHGAARPLRRIRPGIATLAERLRSAGYRTAAVVNAPVLHPAFGFGRGFDVYEFHPSANSDTRRAGLVVETALRLLEASAPEPLFLFVHLFDPHLDYDPLPPWDREWTRGYSGPYAKPFGDIERMRSGRFRPGPEDTAFLHGLYAGEVAAVDHALGPLFAALEQRRRARDVALAITADHGEEFGEHGGWEHGHAVYRELVQVPLLLDLPHASAAAGAVVGTQVRAFDLFPTLLELAGAAVPEDVPARSLLPLASAGAGQASEVASRQDREVVCGHLLDGAYTVGAKGYRDGRFSLVAHDDGRFELYDALRDPAELHDLAPARPETVRALGDLLRRRVAEAERLAAAIPSEAVPVDAGTEEALRGLGYVK